MPDNAYVEIVDGLLTIPASDGADNFQSYAVPNAGFLVAATSPTSLTKYTDAAILACAIGYASEIWQRSAGSRLSSELGDLQVGVGAQGAVSLAGSQIQKLAIQVTEIPSSADVWFGDPNILDVGFIQFIYENGATELQPVQFENAVLFPVDAGATGYNWFFRPGYIANISAYTTQLFGQDVLTGIANELNFLDGLNAGANPLLGTATQENDFGPYSITIPSSDGFLGLSNGPAPGAVYQQVSGSGVNEYHHQWCLLSYLAEAWEAIVGRQCSSSFDNLLLQSGPAGYVLPQGRLRSVQAIVVEDNTGGESLITPAGFRYYGRIAPLFPEGWGRVQYINASPFQMIPEKLGAIGFSWWLNAGISMNLTYFFTENQVNGTVSSNGAIRLADGVLTGL